ncbi:hypothetical protein [Sanyastnella coralliicola]|uniref:hypothetical protein n=1 Tax=Sanyastnella coralliicola TaxID=3069118 RepID=UPI0027B9BCAB|nr:hypothetical protein [Longitalea sp. SCSIO 12813]
MNHSMAQKPLDLKWLEANSFYHQLDSIRFSTEEKCFDLSHLHSLSDQEFQTVFQHTTEDIEYIERGYGKRPSHLKKFEAMPSYLYAFQGIDIHGFDQKTAKVLVLQHDTLSNELHLSELFYSTGGELQNWAFYELAIFAPDRNLEQFSTIKAGKEPQTYEVFQYENNELTEFKWLTTNCCDFGVVDSVYTTN